MCVVSAIHDYGQRLNPDWWDRSKYFEFQELIKKAENFDKATGQPDCVDPKKQEFLDEVGRRVNVENTEQIVQFSITQVRQQILNVLVSAIKMGNVELIDTLSKAYERLSN